MSLKEAVLDIVEQMEAVPATDNVFVWLQSFTRQLRTACKAAGDASIPQNIPAELQHFHMLQKAREEFRQKEKKEEQDTHLVLLVGGSSDGVYFEIGNWPVGAKTLIAGEVYQLREDGKLHYEESAGQDTNKKV